MYKWLEDIGHLSPGSRASYVASVRQFMLWMIRAGHIESDPTIDLPVMKRPRAVPRAQSNDAIGALFAECEDDRDRAIVWLMVGLGLRRAEVCGLRWDDYDPNRRTLLVRRAKGGHERVLPTTPEVDAALRRIRVRGNSGPIIRSKQQPSQGVLPATLGSRLSMLMRRAGIKHAPYDGVSGHALRHTAATDVLEECGDIRVVQQMLGHQQLATTAIYLGRADMGRMRDAMTGRVYERPYDWASEDEGRLRAVPHDESETDAHDRATA